MKLNMYHTLKALAAVCLLGIASTANAATVDFGTLNDGEFVGSSMLFGSGTVIADEWTFTLGSDLLTAISFDSNDSDPFFEISDFTVSSSSPGIIFVFDAADNSYSFSGPLTAGTYSIAVTGTVTGSFAGQYDALVGVSAVPVPSAILLLGSALLGLLIPGRRKFSN